MGAQSIQLLSLPEIKKSLWEQYWQLTEARRETMDALSGMGERHFPDERPSMKEQIKAALKPTSDAMTTPELPGTPRTPSPLRQRIREAAEYFQTGFDRVMIRSWLLEKYPNEEINEGSFSSTLAQIGKMDEWKVLSPSVGGKPGSYELRGFRDEQF